MKCIFCNVKLERKLPPWEAKRKNYNLKFDFPCWICKICNQIYFSDEDLNYNHGKSEFSNIDKDYIKFLQILEDDVNTIRIQMQAKKIQLWRRAYVRSVFAFIEGFVYRLKQDLLKSNQPLGEDEITFLEEKKRIEEKGEEKEIKIKISLKENLIKTFYLYPNIHLTNFKLDTNCSE